MKKITLGGVMALSCLVLTAQQNTIKSLTVGDTVPDIIFNNIINGNKRPINLYSFKNKYIIIDVWSRHCAACITAFPKIEQYQKKYDNRLQIILANPHDAGYEKEVMALLEGVKKRTGYYPAVPIALNDTLLNYYFPHAGVPHYIWINKNSQVAAITGLEEVTASNIEQFISGRPMHLAVKDAPAFKKDLLQLIKDDELQAADIIGYSLFTGYQPGTNLVTGVQKADDGSIHTFFVINRPLSFFITMAYGKQIGKLADNRLLNYPKNADAVYCYQLKPGTPTYNLGQLAPFIKADLEKTFDIKGKLVKRSMECWVIKNVNNIDSLSSVKAETQVDMLKGSRQKFMYKLPLNKIVKYLDQMQLPLLDETSSGHHVIDLAFPAGLQLNNDEQLVGWLCRHGFEIEKQMRMLTVFEFKPHH